MNSARLRLLLIFLCVLMLVSCQQKSETNALPAIDNESTDTASLVLHLPFDHSIRDSSMYGHHIAPHQIEFTKDRFGKADCAALYNGHNSWLEINADSLLDFHDRQSFTITAWVKSDRFTIDWSIIRKIGDPVQYYFGYEDDRIVLGLDREESRVYSRTTLFPDTWYFVAGIYDAERMQLSVYVNSLPDAQSPVLNLFKSKPGNLETGRTSTRTPVYYLDGVLDDIRVYNRPLSEEELRELYHENGWNL